MVRQEGLGVFKIGFFPFLVSQFMLYGSFEVMKFCMDESLFNIEYTWPVLYLTAAMTAHAYVVLATRMYVSRFTNPSEQITYTSTYRLMRFSMDSAGYKSLFRGFTPALVIYSLGFGDELKELASKSMKRFE